MSFQHAQRHTSRNSTKSINNYTSTRLSSQPARRLVLRRRPAEATHEASLEYELVEAVTVFHEVLRVLVDVVAGQIELLQNAVRVQGKCENRAPSAPMSVSVAILPRAAVIDRKPSTRSCANPRPDHAFFLRFRINRTS